MAEGTRFTLDVTPALPQPRRVRQSPKELLARPLAILAVVGVAMAAIFAVTPLSGGLIPLLTTAPQGRIKRLQGLRRCLRGVDPILHQETDILSSQRIEDSGM